MGHQDAPVRARAGGAHQASALAGGESTARQALLWILRLQHMRVGPRHIQAHKVPARTHGRRTFVGGGWGHALQCLVRFNPTGVRHQHAEAPQGAGGSHRPGAYTHRPWRAPVLGFVRLHREGVAHGDFGARARARGSHRCGQGTRGIASA